MTTQNEIALHLGISQQAVSKTMQKMGIDWQQLSLDEIRLAYLKRLRDAAAGHADMEGKFNIHKARVRTELLESELLLLKLQKEKERLIDVDQLMPELRAVFGGMKNELLTASAKLKTEIDLLYGINVDIEVLEDYVANNILKHLSGYLESYQVSSNTAKP